MPIEGIIEGLKEAVLRHRDDKLLADYVSDAIDALTEVDAQLDQAFNDGKYTQLEADYDALLKEVCK